MRAEDWSVNCGTQQNRNSGPKSTYFHYVFYSSYEFDPGISTGYYLHEVQAPEHSIWFHIAYSYIGRNGYQEIRICHDGHEVSMQETHYPTLDPNLSGRLILIGKNNNVQYNLIRYCSIEIDELVYFNHTLSHAEVRVLSQASD